MTEVEVGESGDLAGAEDDDLLHAPPTPCRTCDRLVMPPVPRQECASGCCRRLLSRVGQ